MKGVVYLGHIPYGFFEDQMRSFFAQFGEVINLRLSRNKTTGKSKHFAFIQFASEEVAQIVAETMNGYFLYGKTLIVKMVPPEKVHPDTFIGANKKFRVIPWKQISRQAHNKERNAEQHKKVINKLIKKENNKRAKLKELGITYDFPGYVVLDLLLLTNFRKQQLKYLHLLIKSFKINNFIIQHLLLFINYSYSFNFY